MTDIAPSHLIVLLRSRLAGELPGLNSQLKMAPSQRAALLNEARAENARHAAVLVLLEEKQDPRVVLTERRHDLASHPGQISFPGGRQEPGESLRTTALREAAEEISLDASAVELVGELTPLFVPPSNYMVHPFVAVSTGPLELTPADGEVNTIIRAPLKDLLSPSNRRIETWNRYDRLVEIPLFAVAGHKVWGATAMILAELIDVVRED